MNGGHMTNLAQPKLLLVDDDRLFTMIISKIAEKEKIPITVCHSIKEVGKITKWDFDVAIIDYDLGDFTGVQLTDILTRLREMPVVLVSQYREIEAKRWPNCIKEFINKSRGPDQVINAAREIHRTTQRGHDSPP
jgi:DNA-binding NtrC family response regulator